MTVRRIKGVCPHDCPDTCAVFTEVEDGRAVRFYGAKDHPITQGWLCTKVRPYLDHVYHPERLKYPLRRNGPKGSGQWQRISWTEAIETIGTQWRDIGADFGPEAILPYSYSGTLGLVQMSVSSARFWNRLGASQLERSICGAAGQYAVKATLGARRSPAYEDVQHSKLLIVWGHNPVSTAPHFMPFLRRAQRNGCQLMVIDPRKTRTAAGADWHIAPQPGTDGVLALAVAYVLVEEGYHDEAWLEKNTLGWPQLRERLQEYPPERAAAITGLERSTIMRLARLYGQEKPALIKIADGIQRNFNGGQTVRAICTLPALTGQYGVLGGGLAYSTSDYIRWDAKSVHYWEQCPPPARMVNMNRLGAALLGEVNDPPIKSLYVFGSNPAAIAPNVGQVIAGLQRDDLFTVVHELFMTDTADYADILLPATSQLEHVDLHKAYGHTGLAYNEVAIPAYEEAKSNWDVMRLLAREMGFSEPWLQQPAEEVIKEVLEATSASNKALTGITLESLKETGYQTLQFEPRVPFSDGNFPTASGKVVLYSRAMADQGLDPLPGWIDKEDDGLASDEARFAPQKALSLISGAAHHFVSSSFANHPDFLGREGQPFVEIHAQDAASRDIEHGDSVIMENGRGWCELQAVVTDTVPQGVLASPKGRWNKLSGGRNVNWMTTDAIGDMAGQSTYHSSRVWLRKKAVNGNGKWA